MGGSEEMSASSKSRSPEYGGRVLEGPKPRPRSNVVWRILAIIIGALFVYAGVLKVWDPVRFAGDI